MSNLRQEKREEKIKLFVEVSSDTRIFFRDFTKKIPYNNPIKRPIIIDIITVYKVILSRIYKIIKKNYSPRKARGVYSNYLLR